MATRLSVHAEFAEDAADAEGSSDLKRKAWLAVFAGSSLFWLMVALVVWRLMSWSLPRMSLPNSCEKKRTTRLNNQLRAPILR